MIAYWYFWVFMAIYGGSILSAHLLFGWHGLFALLLVLIPLSYKFIQLMAEAMALEDQSSRID